MDVLSEVVLWLLVFAATLYVWRYLRRNASNPAFDKIPGPPSQSFWNGNMQQFFDPLGFSFHQEIAHEYGPVVKLHGPFGVSRYSLAEGEYLHQLRCSSARCYIFMTLKLYVP